MKKVLFRFEWVDSGRIAVVDSLAKWLNPFLLGQAAPSDASVFGDKTKPFRSSPTRAGAAIQER